MVQQLVDQQAAEKQKQMAELMHANKGVEALGVLVQYLVFNVSTTSTLTEFNEERLECSFGKVFVCFITGLFALKICGFMDHHRKI